MAPDADRPRSDAGRYDDRIDPDTVLDVFDARADQARPLTAGDVVEEMGIARRTAHNKLNALVERGVLETRKVGARGRVWWIPDRQASDGETARETAETPSTVSGDQRDATPTRPGSDDLDAALSGWEPDTEANPRTARTQTRRAAEKLRAVGEYRRAGELKDALAEESTLTPRVWWERHARPGLNHLVDAGLVEYTKNRGYRWVGDVEE
jgi:DNA-binding transcriptional ArsR family regulator